MITRRAAFTSLSVALAAPQPRCGAGDRLGPSPASGRLKQSVSRWVAAKIPLQELSIRVKGMGFAGIDLLFPDEWAVVQDAGLTVSMAYASRREKFIETGFNNPANHSLLWKELETGIRLAGRNGVPNVIAMFGNRQAHINEASAIDHCAAGLSRIAPLAIEEKVTLCVELLNSRVDHPGYQGDHTKFGVAVMQRVNSPGVKLLYDIYHMQIMEGDVIRTIRDNIQWLGHFHTGGVPGRHEIDDTQELNYRAVATAIADLQFGGYVAHEFIPARADPLESLQQAYRICQV